MKYFVVILSTHKLVSFTYYLRATSHDQAVIDGLEILNSNYADMIEVTFYVYECNRIEYIKGVDEFKRFVEVMERLC